MPSTNPSNGGVPAQPERTRWQKLRLVIKVVELRLRFILLMAATGMVFAYWDTIWNYYDKWTRPEAVQVAASSDTEFYCPMHPSVVRDEPGLCPICGMPLSKRKKGEPVVLPEGVTARVQLAPFRVAQAGIRTVEVSYEPLRETLTTVGYVEHDERRVAHIASKIKGKSRVEKLYVNYNGMTVEEGQPLAEIYGPELFQAERELILANQRSIATRGRATSGERSDLVELASQKLKLWGITQDQIDEILRTGRADVAVPILSPIGGGHVIDKRVVEGQYVEEGDPLFVVADLHKVWIRAKVFEDQIPLIHVGQEVEATVDALPGEVFRGTVAFIYPHLDPATRTIDVRFDMPNHQHRLRPGMFASVTLKTPVAETPLFASRRAGATSDPANRTPEEQKLCPVTGLKLGAMGKPIPVVLTTEKEEEKVWTCCPACPPKLEAKPAVYLARLESAPRNEVLTVPESAVIDTGTQTVVYVETEPGVYEGREVVLGPRSGERYPVLEGLIPGEQVAAAGAFLIDAETRLNPAAGSIYTRGSKTARTASAASKSHAH